MTQLQSLLKLMVEKSASDLFLSVGAAPHIKVEGSSKPVNVPPLKSGEVYTLAKSVMTDAQLANFEETLEQNLSISFEGLGRFRINTYYQKGEVSMVVRLINSRLPSFAELRLPEFCSRLAMLKRGLVLFVGAAGSGKSTSLAAMIHHRSNHADGHILSIEDPIEFIFPHARSLVDQREVAIDTHSFHDALRNAMREAPDVIMIGEIRDQETAQHAIAYAETGHLCLSTLHANNTNQAVERLLNFFPEQRHKQVLMDLSLNLKAVVGQRLVPSVSGKRLLATEMMLLSPYISELIRSGRIDEIRETIRKAGAGGMHTFDQCLFDLYQQGLVSKDTALHHADSINDLSLQISMRGERAELDTSTLDVDELEPHHFLQADH